jgi:hypothetical protein
LSLILEKRGTLIRTGHWGRGGIGTQGACGWCARRKWLKDAEQIASLIKPSAATAPSSVKTHAPFGVRARGLQIAFQFHSFNARARVGVEECSSRRERREHIWIRAAHYLDGERSLNTADCKQTSPLELVFYYKILARKRNVCCVCLKSTLKCVIRPIWNGWLKMINN